MRYSFMTFSCPDLGLRNVLALARRLGYDGIEPRSAAKHAHGVEIDSPAAWRTDARRASALQAAGDSISTPWACFAAERGSMPS